MIIRNIAESRLLNVVLYYDLYEKLYYKLKDKYQWKGKFDISFAVEPTFYNAAKRFNYVLNEQSVFENRSLFNSTLYIPCTETAQFLRAVLEYRINKVLQPGQTIYFTQPWIKDFLFDYVGVKNQIEIEYHSIYHWWVTIYNSRFFRNELPCDMYSKIDSLLVKLASEIKGYQVYSEAPIPEFPIIANHCILIYTHYAVIDDENLYIIPKTPEYQVHSKFPLSRIESKQWLFNKLDRYSLFGDLDNPEEITEEIYNNLRSKPSLHIIMPKTK